MNSNILPPRLRFLAFVGLCFLISTTSLFGALKWGPVGGLMLSLPLLTLVFILRWVFFPRFSGRTRLHLASLGALCLPATLYIPSNPIILLFAEWISQALQLKTNVEATWVFIGTQACITAGVIQLNQIWSRDDVSYPQDNPENNKALRASNRDYARSLDRYCTPLVRFLDRYDDEVNWSDRELTPLEAEVETEKSGRLGSKIVPDLVSAIRQDKCSEVFVVLGDPGSGKSVSLRRLVRVLCDQASNTEVVPVYINLREWSSEFGEVTSESLVEFVKEKTYAQTGRDGKAFIDTWYEPFRKSGRLFFVIDSFDELPSILDCDDKSDLHRKISAAFDRFFTQEIYSCRAVLASRHFRAPVGVKGTRLVIQPFKETQIRKAMDQWLLGKGIDTNKYVKDLFRERPQLVPLLRNPFTAELIAEYARSGHENKLPDSMFTVFDHYITIRLEGDRVTFRRYGTSSEQVRSAASVIAKKMYEDNDAGLEVDVSRIEGYLNCPESSAIIEALKYSRIARVGGDNQRRFSFVHRRFAEFFVASAIDEEDILANLQSIPTDSRWRDCLVMYCGIAELSERQKISNFCWQQMNSGHQSFVNGDIKESQFAIHCLRFLNDAYRSDNLALQSIQFQLDAFILSVFKEPNAYKNEFGFYAPRDILVTKIGVEAIPLMQVEQQKIAISQAMLSSSEWVIETALGSCRHIANLPSSTQNRIRSYIREIPFLKKVKGFKELEFSLSISDIFKKQRYALWADIIQSILFYGSCLILLICMVTTSPKYLLGWAAFSVVSIASLYPSFFILDDRDIQETLNGLLICFFIITLIGIALLGNIHEILEQLGYISWLPISLEVITGNPDELLGWRVLLISIAFLFAIPWEVTLLVTQEILSLGVLRRLGNFFLSILIDSEKRRRVLVFFQRKIKRVFKSLRSSFFYSLRNLALFGLNIFLAGLVFWGLFSLPASVQLVIMTVFFAVFSLFFAVHMLPRLFVLVKRPVNDLIAFWKDHKLIRKKGWPNKISCSQLYEICLSFQTLRAAKYYLETIRKLRIPIVGEVIEPPLELTVGMGLGEELGKLREQWYGLSD